MDKYTAQAWTTVDVGLKDLMNRNDELELPELVAKSRRLRHLGRFIEKLAKRVDERIRDGVKPGDIQELFLQYQSERQAIDNQ